MCKSKCAKRIQNLHEMGLTECFLRRSMQRKVVYRSQKPEVQAVVERQHQQQQQRWRADNPTKQGDRGHRITSLSLVDLQSVLVLWSMGVALAVAALVGELTVLNARKSYSKYFFSGEN